MRIPHFSGDVYLCRLKKTDIIMITTSRFFKEKQYMWYKVRELQSKGLNKTQIGKHLGVDRSTVRKYLQMSREDFMSLYLDVTAESGEYSTRHKPCDFLKEDGNCLLGDCKPESCKKYPHTDQPDRMGSLYSIIDFAEVCPVVYEMLERLKEIYGFRRRR